MSLLNGVDHMRDAVFFDDAARSRKLSRFWLLLSLASVIAAAGVVGDSDATVIGAMIVAPLMTPILGTMLAVVLADWPNLARSFGLVVLGAACSIAIGYALGLLIPTPVDAMTDPQVASRVTPGLISLVAALATGAVGSVALVRSDISDTLPGVAISISLVPPLTVVGLTLESGQPSQAAGALLLFVTNMLAILIAGIVVMALYRVRRGQPAADLPSDVRRRRTAVALIVALVVVVALPLAQTSYEVVRGNTLQSTSQQSVQQWAARYGWNVVQVGMQQGMVVVRVAGPGDTPDSTADKASLRAVLVANGLDPKVVRVELVPQATISY
jgi:uncharacterized hydrophobic protein (TIGR00271 family)